MKRAYKWSFGYILARRLTEFRGRGGLTGNLDDVKLPLARADHPQQAFAGANFRVTPSRANLPLLDSSESAPGQADTTC